MGLTLAGIFSASATMAQERPIRASLGMNGCHCANPVNVNITKNESTGMPTPFAGDFSSVTNSFPIIKYNDRDADRHVRDTISWKLPTNTCETKGTVSWIVKNNSKNALQNNDSTAAAVNGVSVPGMGGFIGALAPGQSKPFGPFVLNPAMLKNGRVSVNVQDDTALVEFKVNVTGCCITPN